MGKCDGSLAKIVSGHHAPIDQFRYYFAFAIAAGGEPMRKKHR
jgi:hypothetical protein